MTSRWTSLLVFVSACGASPAPRPPIAAIEAEEPAPRSSQPPLEPTISPAREGSIARSELHAVLDGGVGRFLQRVEISAVMKRGRFSGWRIARYDNPWVDLRRGDIVTAVNGRAIETPSQAQALWASLRDSESIVVKAVREGLPFELRFQVVGGPTESAP